MDDLEAARSRDLVRTLRRALAGLVITGLATVCIGSEPESMPTWSAGIEAYLYLVDDGDYLMPIVTADRGALHLEGRYQYEDFDTASMWVGWNFETGRDLHLELVPMAGLIVGSTKGVAPGLEATLSWKSLELYSESEYVFDAESSEGDFFYNWSELGWQALEWLRVGLVAQRTRVSRTEQTVDRGLFAAAAAGPVELSVHAFNPDRGSRFVALSVAVDF